MSPKPAPSSADAQAPYSRRSILRGSLTAGGAAMLAACGNNKSRADSGTSHDAATSDCELDSDPDYDGGQLLYRRNDGGDSSGSTSDPISEGQKFGDMIIKSSAMYQTHGHVSHMETSVTAKTIIAPHVHTHADQLVIILGVVDSATATSSDADEEAAAYHADPRYTSGSPPALMFQFNPQGGADAGEVIECPVGSYVIKPRGVSHTFWNPTHHRIAYCEISTGIDFEIFVRGSEDISSIEELEALEDECNTWFEDVHVLARLMVEHRIPNVKGMGGLYDAVDDLKAAIEAAAAELGIPVPPDLMDISIR